MDIIVPDLETSEDGNDIEDKEIVDTHTLTIEEEETSVGSADDQTTTQEIEHGPGLLVANAADMQYQFQSNEGVMYRVVHVQRADNVESVPGLVPASVPYVSTPVPQPGVQAVITNPLNGQFYVIGNPQDLTATAPRSVTPNRTQVESVRSTGTLRGKRDDRRRATHNEVERRRRDKINNWIMNLSKIIPECTQDSSKGNFEAQSKGGILAKACDYITELKQSNQRLAEYVKENEHLVAELELVSRQMEELKIENDQLRAQLARHGILPSSDSLS